MVLHGSASTGPTPYDGQYLKSFDFEAFAGQGEIVMTPDINEAKVFPDTTHAFEFYRRSPKCKPWRADGQPNRPLTATNWEFSPVTFEGGKIIPHLDGIALDLIFWKIT